MADGAAVAGAVGSFLAPVVQGAFSLGGIALQQRYNKELADIQNQYNIDMWNRQNEYNSPQAQMQRFEAAGLNPNLIYGQGSAGNASAPAVQLAPEPVHVDKAMQEIGKAFNIQNLMIGYANLRKALSDAKIAEVNAQREEAHFDADKQLGALYTYNDKTGLFTPRPVEGYYSIENQKAAAYYKMQHLAENFNRNYLIPNRWELLNRQYRYLDPQIIMSNYEAKNYPYAFWIGQGARVAGAVGNLIPKIKFGSSRGKYVAPNGRQYYY